MALIACTCPHCGGIVNMEDSLTSGFCTYCGCRIINDRAVVGSISVKMDRTSEFVSTLKLIKYSMHDGDGAGARVLLSKAMQISSSYSDVWFMDAVLDRRNAKSDMARARMYPSLGIFTEEDVSVYRNFEGTRGQLFLILSIMVLFFGVFISLPFAIIYETFYPMVAVMAVGVVLITAAIFNIKRQRSCIPQPVFADEYQQVKDAAAEEAVRRSAESSEKKE